MIIKLSNNKTDTQILVDYLKAVDEDFVMPLSSKVDLLELAQKTLEYGYAYIALENGNVVALVTFYCNDKANAKAFLPILSVKKEFRGKGYARKLVNIVIDVSRLHEMQMVCVDSINPVAIGLYKSVGFKTIRVDESHGIRKEYLQLTIPAIGNTSC